MTKKRTKTVTKPAENVEAQTLEPEQSVTSEEQVIPDSPKDELVEIVVPETPLPSEQPHEESIVAEVTSEVVNGMVKVQVIHGSVGVVGLGSYEAGDTFIISKERAATIDPRFIKIV